MGKERQTVTVKGTRNVEEGCLGQVGQFRLGIQNENGNYFNEAG